ncbi:MAG: ABC transporter permease [Spirochaetaceae bacterium]|jgi:simple sugar transport system permease protein|nr:ABC transporter permease [Spirochaetaceae bacterium]
MKSERPGRRRAAEFSPRPGTAARAFWGNLPARAGGAALILLIPVIVMALTALFLSRDPARTLAYFFFGPLRDRYSFGNMLNGAVPLIFGGLGVSAAMRGGNLNLGGEGQIYAGAFVTAIAAHALTPFGAAGAILALLAGTAFAGAAAGFSGFLKEKWNANELITTFLVSNALIMFTNYGVTGPFLDPQANLQSTRKIAESWRLPRILPPSNLSAALFFALAAAVLIYLFLFRTRRGYEIRLCGINPWFARYGGINTGGAAILSMSVSGALYGLGGGLAVYGTYYAAIKEFSAGMGWNGLAAALLAQSNPVAVIPAAVFFAWIGAGARTAMQFSDVTVEIASIVQSAVFFLVSSAVLRNLFTAKDTARRREPPRGEVP